jgi:folate-binding protein YgfZ
MEDVTLDDVTDTLARVAVHGPQAFELLSACVSFADDATREQARTLPEHASISARFRDDDNNNDIIIAGSRDLGAFGYDVYCAAATKSELLAALETAGAVPIDADAWQTLRIEAGRPLFGIDMTSDTIPLEAGIEDRAISFTKGCYVGQEIIIRVMHRGHGRVARKLVGLQASAAMAVSANASTPIHAGDRDIGRVTSAAYSPALDRWIGMGYVQRDFVEPGTAVSLGDSEPRTPATVVALPHA